MAAYRVRLRELRDRRSQAKRGRAQVQANYRARDRQCGRRILVRPRYEAAMSYQEVARELGVSHNTVIKDEQRALSKLREALTAVFPAAGAPPTVDHLFVLWRQHLLVLWRRNPVAAG